MEPNNSSNQNNQNNQFNNQTPMQPGDTISPQPLEGAQQDVNPTANPIDAQPNAASTPPPAQSSVDTQASINAAFTADIQSQPAQQTAASTPQATFTPQQDTSQNPNLTIVNNVPKPKKSPVAAIIIILLVILLAGGGAAAYFILGKKKTTTTEQQTNNSAIQADDQGATNTVPDGFKTYENKDLGFKFNYPAEWGEVTVTQRARNVEDFEPIKTNFINFSNQSKFTIVISPSNWKFTGGASEWDLPISDQSFTEATKDTLEKLIITKNSTNYLVIQYTGFDGDITLKGALKTDIKKIPSQYVEFKWQPVDRNCGTDNGSGGIKPQLSCYPQADIDSTKAVIQSFSVL